MASSSVHVVRVVNKGDGAVAIKVVYGTEPGAADNHEEARVVAPGTTVELPDTGKPVCALSAHHDEAGGNIKLPATGHKMVTLELDTANGGLQAKIVHSDAAPSSSGVGANKLVLTNACDGQEAVVRVTFGRSLDDARVVEKAIAAGEAGEFAPPDHGNQLVRSVHVACGEAKGDVPLPAAGPYELLELVLTGAGKGFTARVGRQEFVKTRRDHAPTALASLRVKNADDAMEMVAVVTFAEGVDDQGLFEDRKCIPVGGVVEFTATHKPIYELEVFYGTVGSAVGMPGSDDPANRFLEVEVCNKDGSPSAVVRKLAQKTRRVHPPTNVRAVKVNNKANEEMLVRVTYADGSDDPGSSVVSKKVGGGTSAEFGKTDRPVYEFEVFCGDLGGCVDLPPSPNPVDLVELDLAMNNDGLRCAVVGAAGESLPQSYQPERPVTKVRTLKVDNQSDQAAVHAWVKYASDPRDMAAEVVEKDVAAGDSVHFPESDTGRCVYEVRLSSEKGSGEVGMPQTDRYVDVVVTVKVGDQGLKAKVTSRAREPILRPGDAEAEANQQQPTKIDALRVQNDSDAGFDAVVTVAFASSRDDEGKSQEEVTLQPGQSHEFAKRDRPVWAAMVECGGERGRMHLPMDVESELMVVSVKKQGNASFELRHKKFEQ